MTNKKTAYSLGHENSFSPLLKLNEKDREEQDTPGGADAEGSGGEEVVMEEATVEPEERDAYDQLGIKPQVQIQAGAKRTTVVNFKDICKLLRCQSNFKPLLTFLCVKLGGVTASIDGDNRLVLRGKIQQKHVEHALRKYFEECVECRSPRTVPQKEENGFCESSNSCSVAPGVTAKKDIVESLDPSVTKKKKKKLKKKKHANSHTSIFIYVLSIIVALCSLLALVWIFSLLNP